MSNSQDRLLFSDKKGYVIDSKFKMFKPPTNDIPMNIHNQSYHGVLKKHPMEEKVVIVDRYSDLIEIYDIKNSSSLRIKTHGNYSPSYTIDNSGNSTRMLQSADMRFGYIDVSTTKKKIFTLFSGRTRGNNEKKGNFSNTVFSFDWNGNYLSSFKIEGEALTIQALNDDTFLVMEMEKGQPILKEYKTL